MSTQLFDLHECRTYTSELLGKPIKRWVATPKTNIPYAIARRVKQVLETDRSKAKGTFFEITKNGEMPDFMKPRIVEEASFVVQRK